MRRGMQHDQAHRAARLELGGLTQIHEAHREARGLPFLDTALQDLRYTFRTLRRDAGFTVFAILIVALGIGGSSTVFSVVNALLIRPLPFRDPARLVWITNYGKEGDLSGQTVPVNSFLDLRAQNRSFADIAAYYAFYGQGDLKMTGTGEPEAAHRGSGLAKSVWTARRSTAAWQGVHRGGVSKQSSRGSAERRILEEAVRGRS